MKMRIRVTLHNEDESEATTMEVEVPDFEAFTGPDTFRGRVAMEQKMHLGESIRKSKKCSVSYMESTIKSSDALQLKRLSRNLHQQREICQSGFPTKMSKKNAICPSLRLAIDKKAVRKGLATVSVPLLLDPDHLAD